jgi:hypothetical protein
MADVQIAVIDQQDTQIALAVPGVQGPIGLTGSVTIAQAGTAATPGIRFESDTNTGIYSPGADQLAVATNGTGRLFVDATGLVGIGTTSPTRSLEVAVGVTSNNGILVTGSNSPGILISETSGSVNLNLLNDANGAYIGTSSNHPVVLRTNDTERVRLDTSGRLLVGTSSARTTGWTTQGAGEIFQELTGYGGITCFTNSNNEEGTFFTLGKSRGTAVGSNTIVQNNDRLAGINFQGTDGSASILAASIHAFVDGTPGANDMPGRLVFSSTADGASSPTEAMRINSQQELLVGTATRNANGGVLQLKSGITFPATAVAASDANTLDDYEEGTWTPVVTGWTSVTYTFQEGKYIKIGKHLTAWFLIQFSGTSAATAVTITGLPFTGETSSHGGSLTYYNAPLNETSGALIYPDAGTISFYADSDAASILQSNGNASEAYLVGSINSIRS